MSTFDPYGTNMYKGMKVNDDEGRQEFQTMSKRGEKVGFKKRKKIGTTVPSVAINGSSSSSSISSNSNSNSNRNEVKIKNEVKSDVSSDDCNVYIKVEKCEHSSNTLQKDDILIKEENFSFLSSQPLENISTDQLTVLEIKTEIKLEPKIESSIPAAKISFGFNAMKKPRKT